MLHGHVAGQVLPSEGEEILAEVADIREIKGDVTKLQARKGGAA